MVEWRQWRTFLTDMVNLPVSAISPGGLLMVQVRLRVFPLGRGKSKDANWPASQKGGLPSGRLGAVKPKVLTSGVSCLTDATCKPGNIATPGLPC